MTWRRAKVAARVRRYRLQHGRVSCSVFGAVLRALRRRGECVPAGADVWHSLLESIVVIPPLVVLLLSRSSVWCVFIARGTGWLTVLEMVSYVAHRLSCRDRVDAVQ